MFKFKSSLVLVCLACIICFSKNISGQITNQSNDRFINEVDSIVNLIQSKWNAPGIAIGLIKDGKVIYKKGYGYKNLQTKEPVTSNTLFSIASSTKSFTSTGIGLLIDEGKLSWDKPVRSYLPIFHFLPIQHKLSHSETTQIGDRGQKQH